MPATQPPQVRVDQMDDVPYTLENKKIERKKSRGTPDRETVGVQVPSVRRMTRSLSRRKSPSRYSGILKIMRSNTKLVNLGRIRTGEIILEQKRDKECKGST